MSFESLARSAFTERERDRLVVLEGEEGVTESKGQDDHVLRVLRLPAYTARDKAWNDVETARECMETLITETINASPLRHPCVYIAGGMVSAAFSVPVANVEIMQSISNDIDVFFVTDDATVAAGTARDLVEILQSKFNVLRHPYMITERAVTLTRRPTGTNLQIVTALHDSVESLLNGFDLSACKLAYHPHSRRFFAMQSAIDAHKHDVIVVEGAKYGQEDDLARRCIKYLRKGFDVALRCDAPNLCRRDINSLSWMAPDVHGLARLLTLDRMMRSPAFCSKYRRFHKGLHDMQTGKGSERLFRHRILQTHATTNYYMDKDREVLHDATPLHLRESTRMVRQLQQRADLTNIVLQRRQPSASDAEAGLSNDRRRVLRALHVSRFALRLPVAESSNLSAWMEHGLRTSCSSFYALTPELQRLESIANSAEALSEQDRAFLESPDASTLLRTTLLRVDRFCVDLMHVLLCSDDVDEDWWIRLATPHTVTNNQRLLAVWYFMVRGNVDRMAILTPSTNRLRSLLGRFVRASALDNLLEDYEEAPFPRTDSEAGSSQDGELLTMQEQLDMV